MSATPIITIEAQTAPAVAILDTRQPVEENLSQLFERVSIQEPPKPRNRSVEQINLLFESDDLLIRSMQDEVLDDIGATGEPKLGSYKKEAEHLKSKIGLRNSSSTLLVKDQPVGTYKSMGVLLNGHSGQIQHVSGIDSNSSTDEHDQLSAGSHLEFATLKDLANATRDTDLLRRQGCGYNEVNGTFVLNDLEGLYLVVSPTMSREAIGLNKTKMRIVQALFYRTYGIELPIMLYDPSKGTLTPISKDKMDIRMDISSGITSRNGYSLQAQSDVKKLILV